MDLGQIAKIVSGYAFRGAVIDDAKGGVLVLQVKDVDAFLVKRRYLTLSKISSERIRNPNFLQLNDVLLVARSLGAGGFRSSVFLGGFENVIATASIIVIRVNDVNVLPGFLALYLNSEKGQRQLMDCSSGSSIKSLSVKKVAEIKIPVPTISHQKILMALSENILQQETLLRKKMLIQKGVLNSIVNKI